MSIVVDLEGVGQDLLSVPIKAECLIPNVKISPMDELNYGDVFIRHP